VSCLCVCVSSVGVYDCEKVRDAVLLRKVSRHYLSSLGVCVCVLCVCVCVCVCACSVCACSVCVCVCVCVGVCVCVIVRVYSVCI
jgi:hypothetical protein